MNRRPFKIPSLRQLREHERERIQERLELLNHAQSATEAGFSAEHDTRQMAHAQAELDSERYDPPAASRAPQPYVTGVHARLSRLDGTFFADLPCDGREGIIVLGRGQAAAVRIDDPYVHRVHAHLRWDAAARIHIIAHGGGENGTYVNRKRITEPMQLYSGAHIRLGRSEFVYKLT